MTKFETPSQAKVSSKLLDRPKVIYSYTHYSASSLVVAFDDAKTKRGNVRGVLTDQEQDILRASLVMCCAGIDAVIKQSIRDCFEHLLDKSKSVHDGFEKFVRKRLGGDPEAPDVMVSPKFLAQVLADKSPRKRLIEEYIKELTGDSLQSAEEILRTLSALGVEPKSIDFDVQRVKSIFQIRNKIIHELDIDISKPGNKRVRRSQYDLLENSDHILSLIKKFLESLDKHL